MADRMIEELEEQLDAIAVCVRSEGLPTFLQGAWPDLPDILTDAATQLRRLRKIYEDAPEGPWLAEREVSTNDWVVWLWGVSTHTREFRGTKSQCIAVRDALNRLKGDVSHE